MKKKANIFQLFKILPKKDRYRVFSLQFYILLVSISEIFSVVLISSLSSSLLINGDSNKIFFLNRFELQPFHALLIFVISITLSSILSIWLTYKINKDTFLLGYNISSKLLYKYLGYKYDYYLTNNSNIFVNKIISESTRLTSGILLPYFFIFSKIVLLSIALFTLLYFNFKLTIILSTLLLFGYLIYYIYTRPILSRNSILLTISNQNKLKLLTESFNTIRDVILLRRRKQIIRDFKKVSQNGIKAQTLNNTISMVPRYLMELLSYFFIIILCLFLFKNPNYSEEKLIETISLFSFIALKILPSMQQVFNSLATIKGNKSVLPILLNDFKNNEYDEENYVNLINNQYDIISKLNNNTNYIVANNVSYTYPLSKRSALRKVNLKIPINKISAFVGASGSGKSTMADIISGLLEPENGVILFDGKSIKDNIYKWRESIAYVSQEVKLINAPLIDNIISGSNNKLDIKKLNLAIKNSGLTKFVESLEDGINSVISESGSNLSGGQKQRVGIARALYRGSKILIMDESTSALDSITEKSVLNAIFKLKGQLTVIFISHRFNSIKNVDNIFFFEKGNLEGQGKFDDLYRSSILFRAMAEV